MSAGTAADASARVRALARARVAAYARGQAVFAPTLATLVLLTIVHAGGRAPAVEAYGFSALTLLGVLAWQAKLAFDVEPDTQRLLSVVAVGGARRELAAGLAAAAVTTVPTVLVALAVPWFLRAITPPASASALAADLGYGVWIHALAVLPALAIGAWASRAVSRAAGVGVLVLVGGTVLVLVLGLQRTGSVGWVVPRLSTAVRVGASADVAFGVLVTVHALLWTALALAGWARVRLTVRP